MPLSLIASDKDGATIDLAVLGGFNLRRSGETVDLPTRKLACLLTYLACTAPAPQPREKLAALLWGNSTEERARHNLRQTIAKLRHILGPGVILSERDALRLAPGALACDAVTFNNLIRDGSRDALAAAVDLFRGPFLEGIAVTEEAWSDWLQIERERCAEDAIGAMLFHGDDLLAAGDVAQAVSLGRRAVALNRFREDAHRLIMKGFAAGGRKSEALTHFRELSAFLEAELSIEPDEETRRLAGDLDRQRAPSIASAPAVFDPLSKMPEPPGREMVPKDASERRIVTVLVCNFVNSGDGNTAIDPEDLQEIVSSFQKMVSGAAVKFGGYIVASSGNSVQVYFGYPRANAYDAAQAARAGLAIVAMGHKLPQHSGKSASISAGIATGPVIFSADPGGQSDARPSVVGEAPDIAARLQATAATGTLLVSHKTRLLLGEMFEFRAFDASALIASSGASVWTIVAEKAGLSRLELERGKMLSPLVGRDNEMDMLTRFWDMATKSAGQAALIVGEAGIGKSRLSEALVASIEAGPHILLRYQCSPYHAESAFYPVIQHIVATAGFALGDSNETRLDRLEALLSRHAEGAIAEEAATLAQLVGLDGATRYGADTGTPQQCRNRTLAILVNQLERLSLQHPVLLLIEDAHWIDPTTLDLIGLALERIAGARVFLIITARPSFAAPLASHPNVKHLTIGRLARQPLLAIARHVAGDSALPEMLADGILARTDGNPLYVEEMTKAVIESASEGDGNDTDALTRSAEGFGVPLTLHDTLMERLERLSGVKELAQVASVIGRTFDLSILADLSAIPPQQVTDVLDRLVSAELLFCTRAGNDFTYSFKHALLRDAAYESMLRARRVKLHRRLYELLLARGDADPEIRAYHADIAGLPEAALESWEEAGRSAIARSAFKEAVAAFKAAIRLCSGLGTNFALAMREQRLQVQMGQALIASEGYSSDATMSAFARATELADAIGTPNVQLPAIYGLWANHYFTVKNSVASAQRFYEIANLLEDDGPRLVGLRIMALEKFHSAQLQEALELADRSISLYEPKSHHDLKLRFGSDPRVAAAQYRSWCLWHLGLADQAVEQMEQSLAWARASQHVNTIGLAMHGVAVTGTWLRLDESTERMVREAVRLSEEMSLVHSRAWGLFFLGVALHRQGKQYGLEKIEAGLDRIESNGDKRFSPMHLSCAAEAYADVGRHRDATKVMAQAFSALHQSKDAIFAAELHRVRARVTIAANGGSVHEAEAYLRQAICIAHAQGCLALKLRAATDLATLLAGRGEKHQAADLLRPLHASFTEGFEKPDLMDAGKLLGELQ